MLGASKYSHSNQIIYTKAYLQDTCLAYAYFDTKCALLGVEFKDAMCSIKNKEEVVGIKCKGNLNISKRKTKIFSESTTTTVMENLN